MPIKYVYIVEGKCSNCGRYGEHYIGYRHVRGEVSSVHESFYKCLSCGHQISSSDDNGKDWEYYRKMIISRRYQYTFQLFWIYKKILTEVEVQIRRRMKRQSRKGWGDIRERYQPGARFYDRAA